MEPEVVGSSPTIPNSTQRRLAVSKVYEAHIQERQYIHDDGWEDHLAEIVQEQEDEIACMRDFISQLAVQKDYLDFEKEWKKCKQKELQS